MVKKINAVSLCTAGQAVVSRGLFVQLLTQLNASQLTNNNEEKELEKIYILFSSKTLDNSQPNPCAQESYTHIASPLLLRMRKTLRPLANRKACAITFVK